MPELDEPAGLEQREADLAERERLLEERERQLARGNARLEDAIASQKKILQAREREATEAQRNRAELSVELSAQRALLHRLQRGIEERERLAPKPVSDEPAKADAAVELAARERALEERIAAVTARENTLVATAAAQSRERAALEARAQELSRREHEIAALERERASREVASAGEPTAAGRWNLHQLERRVALANGSSEQAAMWSSTLVALRGHADYEGKLPGSFDALVEDVFGDLHVAGP